MVSKGVSLTRLGQLRSQEKDYRLFLEQKIRDDMEVKTAALRQQIVEAIVTAKDQEGASWADIKRAYGTTNHNTVKELYAEAGEMIREGILVVKHDGPIWILNDDKTVSMNGLVRNGELIEHDPLVWFKENGGWNVQDWGDWLFLLSDQNLLQSVIEALDALDGV